jgi:hypothetical protein
MQKEEFSVTRYMCDTYTWRKAKRIHKKQTHRLIREDVHKDYYRKSSDGKKISGHGSQGAWRQGELIGGKPLVVK